ncbi:MAG: flap endonuclease [Candidatus Eisenbacteria bacterium]|uniref:Flap endonuclease n=1 Tax=Eiseniibacteriota bacterium TaxID=2212470 RepID=A0A956M1J8_UNCEI|nr:flap endonuclease [Candidatus Eisenbacteria bacterium]
MIDGTFELFRCFHGAPRARTEDGREVGAARGFLFTMIKLLRRPDAGHVAVAFDAMAGRTRVDRENDASTLIRSQYLPATDVLRALGVAHWPILRAQADDALATAAARFAPLSEVERVIIATTDKDLLQCAGPKVEVWDRIRDRHTTMEEVQKRFGVRPALLPDLFALVGDPSDGMPGIPKWGLKAAGAVLARYGSIENIPLDAEQWDVPVRGAQGLVASLRTHHREAVLMRDLLRLRTDLLLPTTLDAVAWRGADRRALTELTAWMGGSEMLEKIPRWRSDPS